MTKVDPWSDEHEALTFHPLGIGDVNSNEKGSGARYNADKPDYSLIPLCTLEDEARVWMHGKAKYSKRGDCTCSAGNAARQRIKKARDSAAATTKPSCESATPPSLNGSEPTAGIGMRATPSASRRSSVSAEPSARWTQPIGSSPNIDGSSPNTAWHENSTTPWWPVGVPSADPRTAPTLTTAMPPGSSEECFAIPATLALDLSSGLKHGLTKHSPTCGVHETPGNTGAWNWAKGMPWSVPFGCLMRHMAAWQRGEELDPESGLPHLAHAMCNLRMLTLYAKQYPEGDDRPTQWIGG